MITEEERNRFFQTPDGQKLLSMSGLSPKNIPIPEEVATKIQERIKAFEDSLYSTPEAGGGSSSEEIEEIPLLTPQQQLFQLILFLQTLTKI